VRGFRRQQVLGGHEPIGRTDFADDELPVALEVNSLTYHTTPTDRAEDERRYQALMDAGFSVCVIWETDLWAQRRGVVDAVTETRRRASAGQRVVVHSPGCPWVGPLLGAPRWS
jgi:very-short-patch-repair endonuclease